MAKNPPYTQKTLAAIKEKGFLVGMVERFIKQAGPFGTKMDLFGIFDLLYLDTARKVIVGVQSTGPHGHAEHRRTIVDDHIKETLTWLRCGGVIELWSWRKLLIKRGGKQRVWVPRVEGITRETM